MKDDQRVALTKRLLREGLLRLLKTKDISKIGVSELCAESGINRATFYRHYNQPRDIITQIRREMFLDVSDLAEQAFSPDDPQKWLENMCRYFYDRADLLNILFQCRTDDAFVSMINELFWQRLPVYRRVGWGTDLDDAEMKLTTYCFAGGIYYILRQWITEPIAKTPQEVARVIGRFLML